MMDGLPCSPNGLTEADLSEKDALLILSVGGGNVEKNVSANLVAAVQLAKERGTTVLGIVGRDGGYTAQVADVAIVIPTVNPANSRHTPRHFRR